MGFSQKKLALSFANRAILEIFRLQFYDKVRHKFNILTVKSEEFVLIPVRRLLGDGRAEANT